VNGVRQGAPVAGLARSVVSMKAWIAVMVLAAGVLGACGPSRDLVRARGEARDARAEVEQLRGEMKRLSEENTLLKGRLKDARSQVEEARHDADEARRELAERAAPAPAPRKPARR
jgi:multidrug resistance efflux pump